MLDLLENLQNYTSNLFHGNLFSLVDRYVPWLGYTLPQPYKGEIKGLSHITGLSFGDMVLYNIFYEVFTVCTSIVLEGEDGKLYHGRNLDFGLFLG